MQQVWKNAWICKIPPSIIKEKNVKHVIPVINNGSIKYRMKNTAKIFNTFSNSNSQQFFLINWTGWQEIIKQENVNNFRYNKH